MPKLPSARGNAKPSLPLIADVVREISSVEDLEELMGPPAEGALGSTPGKIKAIRNSHHALARALAHGMENQEAALHTGYSPVYISILKDDPTFRELLAYYQGDRERDFADVNARMVTVGLSALDEIQDRLEVSPEKFSNRELLEVVDTALVKGRIGSTPQGGAAAPPMVNIQFVGPSLAVPTIDATGAALALPTGVPSHGFIRAESGKPEGEDC